MSAFTITDLPQRMQAKIAVTGDCWIWTGARNSKGYGSMSDGQGNRSVLAHRKAYTLAHGRIPPGLQIDHLCETPPCVNPAHLEAVTGAENMRRRNASITHCAKGHPLSGDNLRLSKKSDGCVRRVCVTCAAGYVRAHRARQKERAA